MLYLSAGNWAEAFTLAVFFICLAWVIITFIKHNP